MTGNTASFSSGLVRGEWVTASERGAVILLFVAGLLASRCIIEIGHRAGWRCIVSIPLLLECVLLASAIWLPPFWGLAAIATAMGLQTATLTKAGALTVYTCFITGALTKFAKSLAKWIFESHRESLREAILLAFVWCAYAIGAISGTFAEASLSTRALGFPIALLAGIILLDRVQPISVHEEFE